MKFTARRDVDTDADTLFDAVSDFDRIERLIVQRGARVRRVDPAKGSPMAWDVAFDWRGRTRELRLAVTRFDRPEKLEMTGASEAFDVRLDAGVVALSRGRSRLTIDAEIKPRTMRARLMLQTARLGKGRLDRAFADRIEDYVASALG